MHFDNWLFFLLVAVAILFRWLASAANKGSKSSDDDEPRSTSTPRTNEPIHRAPAGSEEERIRKFLEALGQPQGSQPPRRVTPREQTPMETRKRVVLPHVPPFGSPLPPLTTRPPELPKKIQLPGQFTTPPYEQKTFKPTVTEAPVFEVQQGTSVAEPPPPMITTPAAAYAAVTEPKATPSRDKVDVIALLKSPSGLRNAIILREIFGPPRSLQPVDLVGSA
jgi:hypothetical protein